MIMTLQTHSESLVLKNMYAMITGILSEKKACRGQSWAESKFPPSGLQSHLLRAHCYVESGVEDTK